MRSFLTPWGIPEWYTYSSTLLVWASQQTYREHTLPWNLLLTALLHPALLLKEADACYEREKKFFYSLKPYNLQIQKDKSHYLKNTKTSTYVNKWPLMSMRSQNKMQWSELSIEWEPVIPLLVWVKPFVPFSHTKFQYFKTTHQ